MARIGALLTARRDPAHPGVPPPFSLAPLAPKPSISVRVNLWGTACQRHAAARNPTSPLEDSIWPTAGCS